MTRTVPLLLVVDDEAAFAQGLASELAAQGYETVMAADGQQGLEVFSARHPDLVVTDDAMPRLDGFGLIEAIRRMDRERWRVLQGELLAREVRLTPTEFAILEVLALSAGRPVGIAQIAARVWKGAPTPTADSVRVQVGALRRKLEPEPSRPRYIVTEPRIGYRFAAEPLA